jgi:hypothetical protein
LFFHGIQTRGAALRVEGAGSAQERLSSFTSKPFGVKLKA